MKNYKGKLGTAFHDAIVAPVLDRYTIKNDYLKWTKDWAYSATYRQGFTVSVLACKAALRWLIQLREFWKSREEHEFFVDPRLSTSEREDFEETFFMRENESDRERIR